MPLTQQEIDELRQLGIDPSQVVELPDTEMSSGQAAGATLKGKAGGLIGGGVGSLAGPVAASYLLGPEIGIPATIGAAIVGGLAGSYGGQKLQDVVLPEETTAKLQQEAALAEQQHPIVSGVTELTAGALLSGGKPSVKNLKNAGRAVLGKTVLSDADQIALKELGKEALSPTGNRILAQQATERAALRNVGLQAAINPAIETGLSLATTGEMPSLTRLLGSAAGGAVFSESSKLGKLAHRGFNEKSELLAVEREIPNTVKPAELPYEDTPGLKMVEEKKPVVTNPVKEDKAIVLPKETQSAPTTERSVDTIIPKDKAVVTEAGETQEDLRRQLEESGDVGSMKRPVSQDYSPEDLQKYIELTEKQREIVRSGKAGSEEHMALWKEWEDVRNKYGGMPPKNLNTSSITDSVGSLTRKNEDFDLPVKLSTKVYNNEATTKTVLESIGKDSTNPYSSLAEHLLNTADKESLEVQWKYVGARDTDRSHYSLKHDKVGIDFGDILSTSIYMEEAVHSMTSKKLGMFKGAQGAELKNRMNTYLEKGTNEPIKDIIRAYQKTAELLGYEDLLFKDTINEAGQLTKGAAGNPDLAASAVENSSVAYAMGSLHEFVAHAFKNYKFQRLLNEMPSGVPQKSMWQRIVDSVSKLLGLDVKQSSMLDHVLRTSSEIIAQKRPVDTKETGLLGAMQKASDKDTSKKGFFSLLESTFDRVDKDSKVIGDAGRRWQVRRDEFLGLRNVALDKLSNYSSKLVDSVAAKHREAFRNNVPVVLKTQEEREISQILKDYYLKIADIRREQGLRVDNRTAGRNEWYVPDQLNDKTLDLFITKPLSQEAIYAENKWVDHVYKESNGIWSKDEIRKDIQDYIAALGGEHNNYNSVKFGAIRRSQGFGLPEGLRETDAQQSLEKYGRRAANDLAMYMEIEKNPVVAASLKLNDPNTGILVTHPDADPRLAASQNVKDMMKWVTNGFSGTMSSITPKINSTVRAVNNAILGTATGIRDTIQMPVFALPYINKFSDLSAAFKGILNFRNESRNALATGARQPNIDRTQFNELLDSPDKFTSLMQKVASGLRKYQGREFLENMNRDITFSVGKELAKQNLIGAKAGDAKAIEFLKKFGTLVDNDITTLTGNQLEDALNKVAKNFTDRNQGTYGGAGLPTWIVESKFAPFFALQKWSIEKSNVIYQDVVKPFMTGENRLPLITYTLGSLLTGAAIQEINKLITGRKGQDPTWKEAWDEGNAKNIAGELATLMQLSSLGGIVGDSMKFLTDSALFGKTPRNMVSFPTATAAFELQDRTIDMLEALRNGENPWDVWKMYATDLISHNVQLLRAIANHTMNKEEVERSDKFRDVRVFNELEGGKASEFTKTNKYLGIDSRKFKQTGDINEAMQQLPKMIAKAVTDSDGDPYKLMSSLRSIKQNSYQTMPNMQNMPIKFLKYIQYLKNTQGEEAAVSRLQDYLTQTSVNKAKASMVP